MLQNKRLHLVLYLDGEEEWLDLSNEMVVYLRATKGGGLSTGHFLSSKYERRDSLSIGCRGRGHVKKGVTTLCAPRGVVLHHAELWLQRVVGISQSSGPVHGWHDCSCQHRRHVLTAVVRCPDTVAFCCRPAVPVPSSGEDVPKARDALGWHVSVYWKDDKQFYNGQVVDFDATTCKHKVGAG